MQSEQGETQLNSAEESPTVREGNGANSEKTELTIYPEKSKSEGRQTVDFFSAVTQGLEGAQDIGAPFLPWHDLGKCGNFIACYESLRSSFDRHISTNIPGYYEVQAIKGSILTDIINNDSGVSSILDVGASEGAFVKAICALTGAKKSCAVAIDPNPQMWSTSQQMPKVNNAVFKLAAFGYKEDEGNIWETFPEESFKIPVPRGKLNILDGMIKVPYFVPKRSFKFIHESETFQFISTDRLKQVKRVKDMLSLGGMAIFEEKFRCDPETYARNEYLKDAYFKTRFYSEDYIVEKNRKISEGGVLSMVENQVFYQEMEDILKNNFKYVFCYWVSGNFRGYAASDSKSLANKFFERTPTDENFISKIKPTWIKFDKSKSE